MPGRSVVILSRRYDVPDVQSERLSLLQGEIERRRALLSGQSKERRLFGLLPARPAVLDDEQRLEEMEGLVSCYDDVVGELSSKVGECRRFFEAIARGVDDLFGKKAEDLERMDARRRELAERSRLSGNEALASGIASSASAIKDAAATLTRACLLILRKIDVSREALELLVNDEAVQRKVLGRLNQELSLYRDAWSFRRDMERLRQEIAQISRIAVSFESILRDNMGPFQTLVEEIGKVDGRIGESLADIERLSLELETNTLRGFSLQPAEEKLLGYMVKVRVKQDVIREALERLRSQDDLADFDVRLAGATDPSGAEGDVEAVIANMRDLVSLRMADFWGIGDRLRGRPAGPSVAPATTAPQGPRAAATFGPDWVRELGGAPRLPPFFLDVEAAFPAAEGRIHVLDPDTGEARRVLTPAAAPSSPIIASGGLLCFGASGGLVLCLRAATGEEAWRFQAGGRVDAAPAFSEGHLFCGGMDGVLSCVSAETGEPAWRFQAGSGIASSAVPACGTVFLGCNDGVLYAVDAQSGRERFRVKTGSRISGAPAVAERTGGGALVLFGSNDGNLYAVDASDGKEVWVFRTGSAGVSSPALPPQGGLAVFTAQNRTLYGVDLDGGTMRFRVPREEALLLPLFPRGSRILAMDRQGQAIALDQGTGTEAWRQATGITPAAGPAVSGRTLLVQGRDGRAARFTLPEEG